LSGHEGELSWAKLGCSGQKPREEGGRGKNFFFLFPGLFKDIFKRILKSF
jgi:hypothetical protein